MRVFSLGIAAFFGLAFLAPASSSARDIVHLSGYPAGTIVIKTGERRLYYVTDFGSAIRYPVGVGKAGMAWSGECPSTANISNRPGGLPPRSEKTTPGCPPLFPAEIGRIGYGGAAAMTLSGGGEYAIHGTNNPGSVGGFVSHGCIRMHNADIMDLYARVSVGTTVVVLR